MEENRGGPQEEKGSDREEKCQCQGGRKGGGKRGKTERTDFGVPAQSEINQSLPLPPPLLLSSFRSPFPPSGQAQLEWDGGGRRGGEEGISLGCPWSSWPSPFPGSLAAKTPPKKPNPVLRRGDPPERN